MLHRELRPKAVDPPTRDMLPEATSGKVYPRAEHFGDRIAECYWAPWAPWNPALGPWMAQDEFERSSVGVILTLYDDGRGRWAPQTVACEGDNLPGEWAYFLARHVPGGGLVGAASDAKLLVSCPAGSPQYARALQSVPVKDRGYLFELAGARGQVSLMDGRASRPGGPMCANDARGLGRKNNARLMCDGAFMLLPGADVPPTEGPLSSNPSIGSLHRISLTTHPDRCSRHCPQVRRPTWALRVLLLPTSPLPSRRRLRCAVGHQSGPHHATAPAAAPTTAHAASPATAPPLLAPLLSRLTAPPLLPPATSHTATSATSP